MGFGDLERLGGADIAKRFEEMGRGASSHCQAVLWKCCGGKVMRGKTGRAWLGEVVAVVTAVLQQWCGGRYRRMVVRRHSDGRDFAFFSDQKLLYSLMHTCPDVL
jgi:hypothetical protein